MTLANKTLRLVVILIVVLQLLHLSSGPNAQHDGEQFERAEPAGATWEMGWTPVGYLWLRPSLIESWRTGRVRPEAGHRRERD